MAEAADASPVTSSARVAELRACSAADRAEAIEQLGALLCATQAALCDVVTAADAEADWRVDGATGMGPWLVGTLHITSGTAREWVRVGKAFDGLPHLWETFAGGLLSWDQIAPATTFVTAATDEAQAQHLPGCSAAQIEDLVRQRRARTRDDARRANDRRSFRSRVDHVTGGRRYTGFLPDALAARFDAVLDRIIEGHGPDEDGHFAPIDVQRADALIELANQRADADADPDTCLTVVHVRSDVVDGHVQGNGTIDDLQVASDSVLRLLCDSKIEFHIDGPDGVTVGIARGSPSRRALTDEPKTSAASPSTSATSPRSSRRPGCLKLPEVYDMCMARTNIDIDDDACQSVMKRYGFATKREAVNFALRMLVIEPLSLEGARAMRGSGWEGDLDEMRMGRVL